MLLALSGPVGVPVLVSQQRLTVVLGLVAHQDRLVAEVRAALDLLDGSLDVPERHGRHTLQSVGVRRAPLDEEVVVAPHAVEDELRVSHLAEGARAKATDVGIENLGVDLLLVHEGEACLGVVHGIRDLRIAGGEVRRRPGVARHRVRAGHAHDLATRHPQVATLPLLDVGDAIAPPARQPRGPRVCGLGEVGVDVDDLKTVEDGLGHGDSFAPESRSYLINPSRRLVRAWLGRDS
jgi:hypothetical protein